MVFEEYIKIITEGMKIEVLPISQDDYLDEEEDFDTNQVLDQVENIFKKCQINIGKNRQITLFARIGETVVGGIASSYKNGSDYEDAGDYIEYTFDIAVDLDYQKYTVGYLLMKGAIEQGKSLKNGIIPVLCKNWVINPVAKNMLEKLFGFTETADHKDNNWHMEKWL